MAKRIKKPKSLKEQCEDLWHEIIKARAGYASEISGKEGLQIGGSSVVAAHHIYGKSNYLLRFSLENGICTTCGEHNFDAHGERSRQDVFEDKVKKLRGEDIYQKMRMLKTSNGKSDLKLVFIYLTEELKKYEVIK